MLEWKQVKVSMQELREEKSWWIEKRVMLQNADELSN